MPPSNRAHPTHPPAYRAEYSASFPAPPVNRAHPPHPPAYRVPYIASCPAPPTNRPHPLRPSLYRAAHTRLRWHTAQMVHGMMTQLRTQLTQDYVFIVLPDTWNFHDKTGQDSISISSLVTTPAKQPSTDPFERNSLQPSLVTPKDIAEPLEEDTTRPHRNRNPAKKSAHLVSHLPRCSHESAFEKEFKRS